MAFIGNSNTVQASVGTISYFNGDGSTTSFSLGVSPQSVAQVQIYINNVPQNPSSAFSISGNTITFTSAPPVGASNIVVYYGASTTLYPGVNPTGIMGGDATTQFYRNANTITTPYTFPSGANTSSTGPITHTTGVMTVGAGAVWQVN